jgi:hypothetical protein
VFVLGYGMAMALVGALPSCYTYQLCVSNLACDVFTVYLLMMLFVFTDDAFVPIHTINSIPSISGVGLYPYTITGI